MRSNDDTREGAELRPGAMVDLLDHVFQTNLEREREGRRPSPLCIWGSHGIGKTTLVQDYAASHGWKFAYCAPAQFEEMGDLHGLPLHVEHEGRTMTSFAPPTWVPSTPGPGILLLDDLNRADDRILRGLMQLLQNYAMYSWSLPSQWQIVCTANPDGADYSVTSMDDAMLTRMLHATMVFDVREWAKWASANRVDARGIAFALSYPEVLLGRRTTPRSFTKFLEQIASVDDLRASSTLVHALASAALDPTTVAAFMTFVRDGLPNLLHPDEILEAEDFALVGAKLTSLARGDDGSKRVDRLTVIGARIVLYLTASTYEPSPRHSANLVRFLLHEELPNDLRMSLHRELLAEGGDAVKAMMRDRELAERMLAEM